jgi:transposase
MSEVKKRQVHTPEFEAKVGLEAVRGGKRGPKPMAAHQEPDQLYSEIGKLKMELDWLKKSLG